MTYDEEHLTSQASLGAYAKPWSDQYEEGELGFCDFAAVEWRLDVTYSLAELAKLRNWTEWFDEEVAMWADEGEPDRFEDLLTEEIVDSIVVFERDGVPYLWDGNHRVGAALRRGMTSLSAVVGVERSALKPKNTQQRKLA